MGCRGGIACRAPDWHCRCSWGVSCTLATSKGKGIRGMAGARWLELGRLGPSRALGQPRLGKLRWKGLGVRHTRPLGARTAPRRLGLRWGARTVRTVCGGLGVGVLVRTSSCAAPCCAVLLRFAHWTTLNQSLAVVVEVCMKVRRVHQRTAGRTWACNM